MKYSFTKNPESEFFIKNPNLTKKNSGGWEGRGVGVGARVSDFFLSKESKSEKKLFSF